MLNEPPSSESQKEGFAPVAHVLRRSSPGAAVVQASQLLRGLLVARHVLGRRQPELLLAPLRGRRTRRSHGGSVVLLQRVQRLLRALERPDNGRDGAALRRRAALFGGGGRPNDIGQMDLRPREPALREEVLSARLRLGLSWGPQPFGRGGQQRSKELEAFVPDKPCPCEACALLGVSASK